MARNTEILVIYSLSILTLSAMIGSIFLTFYNHSAHELLQITMGGLGALASILAGSRFNNREKYASQKENKPE